MSTPTAPRVLSVGQCGYDDSRIAQVVRAALGAYLDRAADGDEARQLLAARNYVLVLVNRVFDAGDGTGLAFIAECKRAGVPVPLMLVSDYPDAQDEAEGLGALRGFGKSAIARADIPDILRAAVS